MSLRDIIPGMNKELIGLTQAEVDQRIKSGLTNESPNSSSRSIKDILRANILTRFNALLAVLAVVVIVIDRSPFNALFGIGMVINSGIGIFQELRAKATLDKLAILNAPHVDVIRDGKTVQLMVEQVVKDDLVILKLGDQIVTDGPIIRSEMLEVDESLLTGESDPIAKHPDDNVLSGSIVVAGSGVMRAEKVGVESYSAKLTLQAKKFKRASSELVSGTNKLLKWISWMLVIVAPILIYGQLRVDSGNWRESIIHATAAIVGMIPEGLVLLTSLTFMLAVVHLARRKVLVQQMPAVETLARVDTLLLDKTGTLTEGGIRFEAVILDENRQSGTVDEVLATIASRAESPTNDAIRSAVEKIKPAKFSREIAFNSARKWSAVEIDRVSWVFGAPEVIFGQSGKVKMFKKAQEIAGTGKRVLALVQVDNWPNETQPIENPKPIALVVLSEKVRSDAAETLSYFREQQVDIKIISGDSPLTVAAVAKSVGLHDVKAFDARDLPDPNKSKKDQINFEKLVASHNVFGRVQPEQKRLIAATLQSKGHVVAMTGDGVNDALALKKADLGIAMSSGSAATKAVAEIVLMDNKFSHLPGVLSEGRRVIANIERVANLFIIKNVYSLTLALSVTVAGLTYPYLPSQMTVISTLSIGIPAFFLALGPNQQIYKPGFLSRVLKFAVPVGVIAASSMMTCYAILNSGGSSLNVAGTSVSIVVMMIGLWVLVLLARPLKGWKLGLILFCAIAYLGALLIPEIAEKFRYDIDMEVLPTTITIGLVGIVLVTLVKKLDGNYAKMYLCLRNMFSGASKNT